MVKLDQSKIKNLRLRGNYVLLSVQNQKHM